MKKLLLITIFMLCFNVVVQAAISPNMVYVYTSSVSADVITANGSVTSDTEADKLIGMAGGKVIAAINGGFFNSYYDSKNINYPGNYPRIYATILKNGNLINAGGETNAIGFAYDGTAKIDRVKTNITFNYGDKQTGIWASNFYYTDDSAINLLTPDFKLPFTVNQDAKVYSIKDGKVVSVDIGGTYTVPDDTYLIVYNGGAIANADKYNLLPQVGDIASISLTYTSRKDSDWSGMKTIVGGGRMLIHSGNIVSSDTSFNANFDNDPKQLATASAQRSFIAIMSDGRLALGTVSASFNQIAEYLKGIGAIDAVGMDGGASSMLYSNGKYLTRAGRKLASIIVFTEKSLAPAPNAKANSSSVLVNGKSVEFEAYTIDGNNYFKLRDLAMAFSGSSKQFNITWDSDKNAINIISATPYTATGNELGRGDGKPKVAVPSNAAIYLDGKQVKLSAYTIAGNNFFKLRDLGDLIGFNVGWDSINRIITLN